MRQRRRGTVQPSRTWHLLPPPVVSSASHCRKLPLCLTTGTGVTPGRELSQVKTSCVWQALAAAAKCWQLSNSLQKQAAYLHTWMSESADSYAHSEDGSLEALLAAMYSCLCLLLELMYTSACLCFCVCSQSSRAIECLAKFMVVGMFMPSSSSICHRAPKSLSVCIRLKLVCRT